MLSDAVLQSALLSAVLNTERTAEAVTEIRDLLRTRQPATPPPIDTGQGREAGGTLVAVLRDALVSHYWCVDEASAQELTMIASAVARARDRQVAKWLRGFAAEHTNPISAKTARYVADRIEAGAVDRE